MPVANEVWVLQGFAELGLGGVGHAAAELDLGLPVLVVDLRRERDGAGPRQEEPGHLGELHRGVPSFLDFVDDEADRAEEGRVPGFRDEEALPEAEEARFSVHALAAQVVAARVELRRGGRAQGGRVEPGVPDELVERLGEGKLRIDVHAAARPEDAVAPQIRAVRPRPQHLERLVDPLHLARHVGPQHPHAPLERRVVEKVVLKVIRPLPARSERQVLEVAVRSPRVEYLLRNRVRPVPDLAFRQRAHRLRRRQTRRDRRYSSHHPSHVSAAASSPSLKKSSPPSCLSSRSPSGPQRRPTTFSLGRPR
mmetsp:Transcript_2058/g.6243  ORF Transcript_2058/g.6243 Transcript_2058/m.6243 type:complete len:309 (-) Transcript_2058:101-1027(-)